VGGPVRIDLAAAHAVGEFAKPLGDFLGDVVGRLPGPQRFGVREQLAKQIERARVADIQQREAVYLPSPRPSPIRGEGVIRW